jgi:hypothetical protein
MCCNCHHRGLGLIILGLAIGTLGAIHHFRGDCHRAEFERHVAQICVQAAEQVHK